MALDRKKKIIPTLLERNPYLADEQRGIGLIASLLAGSEGEKAQKIHETLDKMIGACGRLEDNSENFSNLRKIVNLLQLPARARILRNTAIVGFGGQHSSGKSSVLNSLLGDNPTFHLPEDTNASTSIATYMMHGNMDKVVACSLKGHEIPLDADALAAISYKFNTTHNINPAQYIEFIAMSLPYFPVEGVALLDTPGYTGNDIATQQDYRDIMRSRKALSSVDLLVWLMSANEPTLGNTDINFIRELDVSGKIAIIVNKCDQKKETWNSPEPEKSVIFESIKKSFVDAGIPYSIMIPYCAKDPDWNDGKIKIINLLNSVVKSKADTADEIIDDIDKQFDALLKKQFIGDILKIDKCIDDSLNPLELSSLVRLRGMMGLERANLQRDREIFNLNAKVLLNWIQKQGEVSRYE